MELLQDFVIWCSHNMRPWLPDIALAFIVTLMVLFGPDLNRVIRRNIRSLYFPFRVLIFVLLCAFGYGLLVAALAPMLSRALASLGNLWMAPVVLGVFLIIGLIAERRNQV